MPQYQIKLVRVRRVVQVGYATVTAATEPEAREEALEEEVSHWTTIDQTTEDVHPAEDE